MSVTAKASLSNDESGLPTLTSTQCGVLLFSILIVALCGIVYELIIGAVSSYLLGNSVYQFSMTIGFFMFAMGVGSLLSKYFDDQYIRNFIVVEIVVALVGGISSVILFMAFPFARHIYEFCMYGLILIIGALVGMEIPILATILSKRASIKESLANVMSLDYLGALLGSVGFPLLLLPSLGLVRSSFAIGLINIFVALLNVVIFRDRLKHYRLMLSACILILLALVSSVVFGALISSFAEKHLYFDQVIYSEQTPYQKLVLTRSAATGEHRLYIDGHIQFASRDEHRYHEYLVHPVMSVLPAPKKILVLGGGDGLAAREILKYPDVESIHLVDIDPEIVRISKELPMLERLNQGSLNSERLTHFSEDAFTFINKPGMIYDRVIIDMPDPHNEAINKLYSKEFYTMISKRMAKGGVLVTQSSSPFFTRRTYWCIEKTLAAVFSETLSYQTALPSFGIWGFHMATKDSALPKTFTLTVDTRAITDESLLASMVFTKDMGRIPSPVNSIMEPELYQLYIEDLSQ